MVRELYEVFLTCTDEYRIESGHLMFDAAYGCDRSVYDHQLHPYIVSANE